MKRRAEQGIGDSPRHFGDVGTVVHVYKGARGYEVEFVDGGGQTVALVTVGADDVRPIESGELLHARRTA